MAIDAGLWLAFDCDCGMNWRLRCWYLAVGTDGWYEL